MKALLDSIRHDWPRLHIEGRPERDTDLESCLMEKSMKRNGRALFVLSFCLAAAAIHDGRLQEGPVRTASGRSRRGRRRDGGSPRGSS